MESHKNSIAKNAVYNVIYTFVNMFTPLITFSYVARLISTADMGNINFFTSLSNYVIMFSAIGISTYGIRTVAAVRDDEEKRNKAVKELFLMNFFLTVFSLIIILISCTFLKKFSDNFILLLINMVYIFTAPFGMDWYFSGTENYAYITKRNCIFKLLSIILVFTTVRDSGDYMNYALILVFSSAGPWMVNFIKARPAWKGLFSGKLNFRQHIRPMITLFSSLLAVNVYTNLDTVMLGVISGDEEVALYGIAVKIKNMMLTFVNAINAVMLPRMSYYVSSKKKDMFSEMLKKMVSVIMMISIPVTIFFIIVAKDVIMILGGEKYGKSVTAMRIIMFVLLFSSFSNITGNQILIPNGRENKFLKAVTFGALIDVILNCIFMPKYGCTGAALATAMAEFGQMSVQIVYSRKDLRKNIKWLGLAKILLAALISAIILFVFMSGLHAHVLIRFFASGMIYFVSYASLLIIVRQEDFVYLLNRFLKKR